MNRPESIFPQALLDVLAGHPDQIVFEHGSRTVTAAELLTIVRRLVAGFGSVGVGPGGAVAMLTSVTPEAFAGYVAAFAVGTRVVGVPPGYSAAQRAHVFGADIDAVLVDAGTDLGLINTPTPTSLLSLGPVDGARDLLAEEETYAELVARGKPEDIARLVFTSGSTGLPKGCIQTYLATSSQCFWQPSRWTPEVAALAEASRRYLLAGTMASAVILDQAVLCLLAGGTAVIPTGDLSRLLPYGIEKYRITSAILPVSRLNAILAVLRTEQVDTSSLRALSVSGSPVSAHRFAEAIERIGPVMYNLYGQSEVGVIAMLTPAEVARWGAAAMSTVGAVYPDVELQTRDLDGTVLAQGRTGEIFVRSPKIMSGYWAEQELTDEVLVDGWIRTYDLGHVDVNGLVHLVGRSRDVIIVNAQICYAGPIEDVLSKSDDVLEAFVIGSPDDRTGEAIHAFVLPAGEEAPDSAELAERVHAELGAINVPSTITIVRAVPRTASGKPDKAAMLAAHQPKPAHQPKH